MYDQSTLPTSLIGDFANDKTLIDSIYDPIVVSSYTQEYQSFLETLCWEWGVKMNITLRKGKSPLITLSEET